MIVNEEACDDGDIVRSIFGIHVGAVCTRFADGANAEADRIVDGAPEDNGQKEAERLSGEHKMHPLIIA